MPRFCAWVSFTFEEPLTNRFCVVPLIIYVAGGVQGGRLPEEAAEAVEREPRHSRRLDD